MGASRVLILSVRAGAGHLRAAQAVEAAFRRAHPGIDVRHEDALDFTNPAFRHAFSRGYEKLARDMPSLWRLIYERLEETPERAAVKRMVALFDRLNSRPLQQLIRDYDPDHILCTHYVPAEAVGMWRAGGKVRASLSVVLTDYGVHAMWVQPGVGDYFVATEEMAFALCANAVEKGVGMHVTGIPVLPKFGEASGSRVVLRQKLGLSTDVPTLLVSAGGLGVMGPEKVIDLLVGRLDRVQVLAVAGRNRKLERNLDALARRHAGKVAAFGFVDNMHELMAASDLALAKSGGLTTSECLAAGLPMVVFRPIPGQEERNAAFLLERGAGVRAQTASHAAFKVEQLLHDPERLERMRTAALCAARPNAAFAIADVVTQRLNVASGYRR